MFRAVPLALLMGLLISPAADAKKDKSDKSSETTEQTVPDAPSIAETGVPAFDDVFSEVRVIHESLDTARTRLAAANSGVVMALKLPADTPLSSALTELKAKAGGNIALTMNGTVPELTPANALPEDVSSAIDAVNTAVSEVVQAQETLAALPDQTAALIEKVKDFRNQINPELLVASGIERSDMPRIATATKRNVEATVATQARIVAVSEELSLFMDTMKDFGADLSTE